MCILNYFWDNQNSAAKFCTVSSFLCERIWLFVYTMFLLRKVVRRIFIGFPWKNYHHTYLKCRLAVHRVEQAHPHCTWQPSLPRSTPPICILAAHWFEIWVHSYPTVLACWRRQGAALIHLRGSSGLEEQGLRSTRGSHLPCHKKVVQQSSRRPRTSRRVAELAMFIQQITAFLLPSGPPNAS